MSEEIHNDTEELEDEDFSGVEYQDEDDDYPDEYESLEMSEARNADLHGDPEGEDDSVEEQEEVDGEAEESGEEEEGDSTEPEGDKGDLDQEKKAEEKSGDEPDLSTKYQIKVDGKTSTVTAEDLIRRYQKSEAAEVRMKEAAESRKEAEFVLSETKKDPLKVALQLMVQDGMKIDEAQERLFAVALDYVTPFVEEKTLPDDQRRLRREHRTLQAERDYMERQRQQEEQRKLQEAERQEAEKIERQAERAISSLGLDKTGIQERVLKGRIYRTLREAHEYYGEPISVEDAAREVAREIERQREELRESLKAEDIAKIAPDALKQAQEERIQKAQKKRHEQQKDKASKSTRSNSKSRGNKKEYRNWREAFNSVR